VIADLPSSGLTEDQIISDFTGMSAPASIGMALACLSPRRALQYVPAAYDTKLNALLPHDPWEVELTYEDIGDPGKT
jgi:hypothetical protein